MKKTERPRVNNGKYKASLKLLHANVRSLRNKTGQVEAFLVDKDIDIIGLTEHWLSEEEISDITLGEFCCIGYSSRTQCRGGGTAVFGKKDQLMAIQVVDSVSKLNVDRCIEMSCVFIKNFSLHILIIYRSPKGNFDAFLSVLEGLLSEWGTGKNLVVMGDFNVHFGTEDRAAVLLCDLLGSHGFERTISDPTRGDYCIDNVFVNFPTLELHAVNIESDFSDHHSQLITFNVSPIISNYTQEQRKCRPITEQGMYEFYNIVENNSFDFIAIEDTSVDQKFSKFMSVLEHAYQCAFPEKNLTIRSDQPGNTSWFNDNLREMRDQLKFLGQLSRQYEHPGNIKEYKNYKKQYKQAIKEAKVLANDRAINSARNPTKTMWNIINKQRKINKSIPSTDISPDRFNRFFTGIAHDLIREIPGSHMDPLEHLKNFSPPTGCFSFSEITFNDMREIINNLKNKSSQDVFGLSVNLIKIIKNLIIIPLTKLVNMCFRYNIFPSVLKKAIVIPVFKKGDHNDVSNYRPISLLPIISKIVEKCMAIRIVDFLESNNCIVNCQYGFRKSRSTVMGIIDLISEVLHSFETMEYRTAVFCDLSKAFDCVTHDLLLLKLKYYNFNSSSIQLIKSYLENRVQAVRVGGLMSAEGALTVGVPQGSVLGPILFLIYINDLPIENTDVSYTLFADDTTLSISADSLDEAMIKLGVAQTAAQDWFNANKLLLNRNKTKEMVFSLRQLNEARGIDNSTKFLGVYVDSRLKWNIHIDYVADRLNSGLFALRRLRECVSNGVLRTAYFALFHSIMSYALLAWGCAPQSARIFGLQRKAVRIVEGLGFRKDCKQAFKDLSILTLPSQYILDSLIYVMTNRQSYRVHGEVHGHNTRHRNNLVPTHYRLARCQNGPNYWGIKFFNHLPVHLRELPAQKFKAKVKQILIKNAFYSLSEFFNFNIKDL